MAQKFLDEPEVHAFLQQHGGEGVPKRVGRDVPLDPGQVHVLFDHVPGGLGRERGTELVHKEVRVFEAKFPTHPLVLLQHPKHSLVPEEDHPFLIALPHDSNGVVKKVHVIVLDIAEFVDPDTAGEEHLDHQDVPVVQEQCRVSGAAPGIAKALFVHRCQHPGQLLFRHGRGQPEGLLESDLHVVEGAVAQQAFLLQPIEKPPKGSHLSLHGLHRVAFVQV